MRAFLIAIVALSAIAAAPGFAEQHVRSINVTPDSAPGWLPSEDQEAMAQDVALSFFRANDKGEFTLSYAMFTPDMKRTLSSSQHMATNQAFNDEAGALVSREIIKVTWTKDPANAPRPGVYAAIDLSTRYANIDRHCGYIIVYQEASGEPFLVMRTQSTMLANKAADAFREKNQDIDQIWKRLSQATCPNYSPVAPR